MDHKSKEIDFWKTFELFNFSSLKLVVEVHLKNYQIYFGNVLEINSSKFN